jgi:hypothetical protein
VCLSLCHCLCLCVVGCVRTSWPADGFVALNVEADEAEPEQAAQQPPLSPDRAAVRQRHCMIDQRGIAFGASIELANLRDGKAILKRVPDVGAGRTRERERVSEREGYT